MKKKQLIIILSIALTISFLFIVPVFASTVTESQVQQAIKDNGKAAVTGNIFVWFLCSIAFLKVSQKIDGFLNSLGINVGNTGGNMMAELMIAGKTLTGAFHGGANNYHKQSTPGNTAVGGNFLSGGLAGSIGRHLERSAVNSATGYSDNSSIGNIMYQSSLQKSGDFANQVISHIAKGDYGQIGSIKGATAETAFISYMGLTSSPGNPLPSYQNIEIGGGRIIGTESTSSGEREFAMYSADKYMAPSNSSYDTLQATDGTTWYRQYAQDTLSRTPYQDANGKTAYHDSIVKQVPKAPPRKDRL